IMATILKFEDLQIWKTSRELSLKVFKLTSIPPFINDFRFRDQARSSAGSIMDNIAEGFERSGRLEFVQFLSHAKGSCGEIRSQIYRAIDQNYIDKSEGSELIDKYETLAKEIFGFIKYLNNSLIKGQKFKDRSV
ncbi:MAG: four helix bundle protein, partial [Flavisolibacter sp.]